MYKTAGLTMHVVGIGADFYTVTRLPVNLNVRHIRRRFAKYCFPCVFSCSICQTSPVVPIYIIPAGEEFKSLG